MTPLVFIYITLQLIDLLISAYFLKIFYIRSEKDTHKYLENPLTGFLKYMYYLIIAITPGAKMLVTILKIYMLRYEMKYIQFLFDEIKDFQQTQKNAEIDII